MAILYKLVIRVDSAIEQLCAFFHEHIHKEGLTAIDSIAVKAIEEPQIFVDTIWIVYEKYKILCEQSLDSNPSFFKSLDSVRNKLNFN